MWKYKGFIQLQMCLDHGQAEIATEIRNTG